MQYNRGITLSLHSVFNDSFFRDSALLWKLGVVSNIFIGCALLTKIERFGSFCHVHSLFSGAISYNCYHYLEVCIDSLDVAVPVAVVYVVAG